MKTTIDEITIEMSGKTVKIYPADNPLDEILVQSFPTQTEALDFYMNQIYEL